jgi:protein-tyrosine phosphatase
MKKIRVLFVCLGNICRSPLAEAVFKHKLKQRGLQDRVEADSCGTSNYHIGGPPDPRTIANAQRNGITIEHLARQFCEADIREFDYVLAMDKTNYQNILKVGVNKTFHNRVRLMRAFDPLEKDADVPDPYHGGEKSFQDVFDILDRSMDSFIDHLDAEHFNA